MPSPGSFQELGGFSSPVLRLSNIDWLAAGDTTLNDPYCPQTVRTDRWRYTRWSDGTAELYDEANDPEETHDLSADSRHRPAVEAMQRLLDRIGPFRPELAGEEERVPGTRGFCK